MMYLTFNQWITLKAALVVVTKHLNHVELLCLNEDTNPRVKKCKHRMRRRYAVYLQVDNLGVVKGGGKKAITLRL